MFDRLMWADRHADAVRRIVLHEPRGHRDLVGAVLTEPVSPGSHAGLLFMNSGGYVALSLHGALAAAALALQRGLLVPGSGEVVADTAAGTIRVRGPLAEPGALLSIVGVPSFVSVPGLEVVVRGRRIRADVAFGGAFYAIVDGEAAGVAIDGSHVPELRRIGVEIQEAIAAGRRFEHPVLPQLSTIGGTIFTGPASGEGRDLRCATVFDDGSIDRSVEGTSMAAVMAVLGAMGLLADDQRVVFEGLVGTTLGGRIAGRTLAAESEAIVPEVSAAVWPTAESAFIADERDPLREGFMVSP